jgi:2-polyprenyl-6-methoxyphenol hydroxylase-like FAD-dependent oxidoreductase
VQRRFSRRFWRFCTALDVEVERGVTAREITPSENGVQVECVDKEGRAFVIHADYLVGAGGAHSPVRADTPSHSTR